MAFDMFRISLDQADVADHGALLERDSAALHLQVLDHDHGVALRERIAIAVPHDDIRACGISSRGIPLVSAIGANKQCAVGVGVVEAALRAGRLGGHWRARVTGCALYATIVSARGFEPTRPALRGGQGPRTVHCNLDFTAPSAPAFAFSATSRLAAVSDCFQPSYSSSSLARSS